MKIQRGFKAVKQEQERREKEKEMRQGKLWRVFFPSKCDEDFEIPVRFLTDEPICFWEHTVKVAGKFQQFTCTGDGCKHCADGDKPRFVGAFLVIDRTEFEYDEKDEKGNKTGKKVKGKDRLKLLVRGQQDLAVLDRLNSKFGLLDRDWTIYKTGSDTSTKWNFERNELDEWSDKKIQNLLDDKYRNKDFYDIIMEQIQSPENTDDEEDEDYDDEEVTSRVTRGVQSVDDEDDEEEDESPCKSKSKLGKKKSSLRRK